MSSEAIERDAELTGVGSEGAESEQVSTTLDGGGHAATRGGNSAIAGVWIFALCTILFGTSQFQRSAGGVLSPILASEMSLAPTTLSTVIAVFFVATLLMQIPAGLLIDRFGVKRVLPVFLGLGGVGCFCFAVAYSAWSLAASRVLIGLGYAPMMSAAYVIFAQWYQPKRFATLAGRMVSLGGIGGLLGTYPFADGINRFGWRAIYVGIAAFSILLLILVSLTLSDVPADRAAAKREVSSLRELLHGLWKILRDPRFLPLLAMGLVSFAPITTITGLWAGPYLFDIYHLDAAARGMALFIMFFSTIVGGFVFGPLDRVFDTRKRVVMGGAALSIVALGVLAIYPGPGALVAIALLTVVTFCQQFYLTLAAHMRGLFPDHLIGRATTCLMMTSVAGIPLMQWLFGFVIHSGESLHLSKAVAYRLAFAGMGAAIAIALLVYSRAVDVKPPKT
jgi:predicted MFS family arabinose efflux permease